MSHIDEYDFHMIRGDSFTLDIGLSDDFPEVIEDPDLYSVLLVLRRRQDDNLPPLLTMIGTYDIPSEPLPGDAPIYWNVAATPTETQELPQQNIVGYCELRTQSGSLISRLFNSKVEISD